MLHDELNVLAALLTVARERSFTNFGDLPSYCIDSRCASAQSALISKYRSTVAVSVS